MRTSPAEIEVLPWPRMMLPCSKGLDRVRVRVRGRGRVRGRSRVAW